MGTQAANGIVEMKNERLDELFSRARRAPERLPVKTPAFFAARVVAEWTSAARSKPSLWEVLCVRGATLSLAAMLLALFASAPLVVDSGDDTDADETADLFSLP